MEAFHSFVLSYIKYKDHDAILRCYTLEKGFQSFYIKGIYAPKNKKKAYLSPLNPLKITVNHSVKNHLGIIRNIEFTYPEVALPEFRMASVLFFIADFLCQVLPHETENPDLYSRIVRFYHHLHEGNYQSHLIFLVEFLENHGLAPALTEGEFLHPEMGYFSPIAEGASFSAKISGYWRAILTAEDAYTVMIPSEDRRAFLEALLYYYQYHFPNFSIPKSLEILYEMV